MEGDIIVRVESVKSLDGGLEIQSHTSLESLFAVSCLCYLSRDFTS